jgi:hypothetical protein
MVVVLPSEQERCEKNLKGSFDVISYYHNGVRLQGNEKQIKAQLSRLQLDKERAKYLTGVPAARE